jgi:hypothetical protein
MDPRATRVRADQSVLHLAFVAAIIGLLTCAISVLGAEPSPQTAPGATEDSRAVVSEKGGALLDLAKFYEQSDEDEKAAALYAEAAHSLDASIRRKALVALQRLDQKHWVGRGVRAIGPVGSVGYDATSTVLKGVSLALVTIVIIGAFWLLVRCVRLARDGIGFLWARDGGLPQVEIGKIAIGSGDGSAILLADVFHLISEEMKRQRELAKKVVAPLSVVPSMRMNNVLVDAISAALDLGERGPKLWALILDAWKRPDFEVGGSATTVADQTHTVIFLRKKGSVVAFWDRTFVASDILSNMKDIAYAALLESHARI